MNFPENTAPDKRSRSAKKYAAFRRRKLEQIEVAGQSRVAHIDPATGRAQMVNIRHT